MQKVILTSNSAIKLKVVKNIFSEYMYDIETFEADSEVSSQPRDFYETEKGAMNRIANTEDHLTINKDWVSKDIENTIIISIENGLINTNEYKFPENPEWYDSGCIIIQHKGRITKVWSAMVPVEISWVEQVWFHEQSDDTYACHIPGLKNKKDPHEYICGISREKILTDALEICKGTSERL